MVEQSPCRRKYVLMLMTKIGSRLHRDAVIHFGVSLSIFQLKKTTKLSLNVHVVNFVVLL